MRGLFEHEADEGDGVEVWEHAGIALGVFDERRKQVTRRKMRSTTQRSGSRTQPRLASGSLITSESLACACVALAGSSLMWPDRLRPDRRCSGCR